VRSAPSPIAPRPRVASADILRGNAEVEIEHRGTLYRLRVTSLGKLILTK
jgi:hemin uptake protein HemP